MIPSRAAAGQVTPGDDGLPLGDYDPTIAVRIECAACGHLMLFNAQWYDTEDEQILVRGWLWKMVTSGIDRSVASGQVDYTDVG